MNTNGAESESLVVIARAVRTRGLKGELVAELLTDFPERFENVTKLTALSPNGARRAVELESFWFHQNRVVLKLVGVDTPEAAREFVDHDFAVREAERVPLPDDYFYDWELEGCDVSTVTHQKLGTVATVVRTGGVELLRVVDAQTGRDYLLPMAESIIVDINPARKLIVVDPPDGLLDL